MRWSREKVSCWTGHWARPDDDDDDDDEGTGGCDGGREEEEDLEREEWSTGQPPEDAEAEDGAVVATALWSTGQLLAEGADATED